MFGRLTGHRPLAVSFQKMSIALQTIFTSPFMTFNHQFKHTRFMHQSVKHAMFEDRGSTLSDVGIAAEFDDAQNGEAVEA